MFNDVLLTSNEDGGVQVGQPVLKDARVTATVLGADIKGEKIDVVHFRAKKDSSDKKGHRQRYTRVKIEKIEAGV